MGERRKSRDVVRTRLKPMLQCSKVCAIFFVRCIAHMAYPECQSCVDQMTSTGSALGTKCGGCRATPEMQWFCPEHFAEDLRVDRGDVSCVVRVRTPWLRSGHRLVVREGETAAEVVRRTVRRVGVPLGASAELVARP